MIEKMGNSGFISLRKKQIILREIKTNKNVAVKLIQFDEQYGWFGENIEGKKRWYNKKYWEYLKEVGT
jgi:hypothetical protein